MPSIDAFTQSVESALEQIDQPAALGQRSPLSAPYFLGQYLNADAAASTAEGRGAVLVQLLRQAAKTLTDDQQAVLNVAFFQAANYSALNELRASALHRSLRSYYRDRSMAVQALAVALGRLVIPPLRAERPRAKTLIGRTEQRATALIALRSGQSLAITGPAGSGKTTLGTHIAAEWASDAHFWFTIRHGFTDNASAVLFGLCHWLRSLGATSAWHQLVADAGKDKARLELSHIRPMLRHDIAHIRQSKPDKPQPLLVCIDDVDLLDPQRAEHDRALDVIRELRDLVPVMLIGQNLILETDQHVQLAGLGNGDVAEMLRREPWALFSPDEIERLAKATRGLPALVQLFSLLHRLGEPVAGTLRLVEEGLSADALFQRAWVRLDEAARYLLMQVAVYDGYAPADEWRDAGDVASPLVVSGLLESNAHDGFAVTSYARAAVLRRILPSLRPALHLQAAEALEQRGEYTSAARQFVQAGQPFRAIALWSEHRAEETERGHAESALAMLRNVSPDSLSNKDERRVLFAVRAELSRKMGALAEGLDDLASVTWPSAHALTPFAETLRGDLHEFSGNIESATAAYEMALRALAGPREAREVDAYYKSGFIHLYRSRDVERAMQAAVQAHFRAERFHGQVLEERGDIAAAHERYQAAAALLPQLNPAVTARAHNEFDLGRIAMKLGHYSDAIARLQAAIQLYDQAGDLAISVTVYLNLSFALNAAGQYDQALEVATARLKFVQDSGDTYLVSALACNAAESCAFLGRLDEAEGYIALAFRQEEEFHRHYILTVQGMVHGKREHYVQAEQHFTEAIRMAQASEDPFGEAPAWRWLAFAHWQQGKPAEAREAIAHARDLYQIMGMAHEVANTEKLTDDWNE
jgi:tetratricopeptide (TPR) repeat protein